MSRHNRLITAVIVAFMSLSVVASGIPVLAPAYAAESTSQICTDLQDNNIAANEYKYDRWSAPVCSYLTEEGSGYMRVQGYNRDLEKQYFDVIYYDNAFNATAHKQVKQDLPLFGAFAETQNNYFIISGQDNPEESDDCEVIRITKYDKSWNRIGSCGLYGANTFIPFDGGSCRVAVVGEHLAIHTCHEMYTAEDGCHHQANMTIAVDSSKMEITYANYWVGGGGYVSHSFDQYVVAGNGKVAVLDLGDAYPRAISLTEFISDLDAGEVLSYTSGGGGTLAHMPGDIGDNDTGVSLGGFEQTQDGYLVAGNSIYQHDEETMDLSRPRNIFVASVDSGEHSVATNWLTDGTIRAGNPQLVKVSDDCYVVMWSYGNNIEYVAVDGSARKISEVYTAKGEISDCKPIVSGGKIIWYSYGENYADFYQIEVNGSGQSVVLSQPEVITSNTNHDWEVLSAASGKAQLRCKRCGAKKTDEYPTHLILGYKLGNTEYTGYRTADVDINDRIKVYGASFVNHDVVKFNAITLKSDDPANCVINSKDNSLTFKKEGFYQITATCKYDTSITASMYFDVTKALESVELITEPQSPQEFGTEVWLVAQEDGGRGSEVFTFTVTDENGSETVLPQSGSGDAAARRRKWTPERPGTYTIKVSVYDEGEPDNVVSDSLVYEATRKAHPAVMPSALYNYPFSSSVVIDNKLLGAAADAGWEFDAGDIGTALEPGEELTCTVRYNKDDKDLYIKTEMEVTIIHSTCDHKKTEVRGARKATCCSEGSSGEEYCLECGELVRASTTIAVDPDAHSGLRTVAGKKAGLWEDGKTDGKVCDDCGRVVKESQTIPGITDINTGVPENAVYKGSPHYANVKIYADDKLLKKDVDYQVDYYDNTNAGWAEVVVRFIGNYQGQWNDYFEITKAANKLAVKGKTASVRYSAVRKKSQSLAASKVLKFTNKGQGTRTYSLVSALRSGKSYKKYFKVNSTTGRVTVKKGLRKGTYRLKVRVKAGGTANYNASARKTVTITIKVK